MTTIKIIKINELYETLQNIYDNYRYDLYEFINKENSYFCEVKSLIEWLITYGKDAFNKNSNTFTDFFTLGGKYAEYVKAEIQTKTINDIGEVVEINIFSRKYLSMPLELTKIYKLIIQ